VVIAMRTLIEMAETPEFVVVLALALIGAFAESAFRGMF
jgi:hypothetical protein